MAKAKTLIEEVKTFCRFHLGKEWAAPLTGQDWSAWCAFVYLVEMYSRGDAQGREAALDAMRATLTGTQNREHIHQVFVQVIPAVMDWRDAEPIWRQMLVTTRRGITGGTNWIVQPVERRPA